MNLKKLSVVYFKVPKWKHAAINLLICQSGCQLKKVRVWHILAVDYRYSSKLKKDIEYNLNLFNN